MKQKSLFFALAPALAFAYVAYRLLQKTMTCDTGENKPGSAGPADFVSRTNPRTPLSEMPPSTGRTGSGLADGSARPEQTSDWYGNKPAT